MTVKCEFCAYCAALESAEAPPDLALPLNDIASEALRVPCGHCWAVCGQPCAWVRPGGKHLARYARARRRGLISDTDMCAVLDAASDVFEPSTVIYDEAEVPA